MIKNFNSKNYRDAHDLVSKNDIHVAKITKHNISDVISKQFAKIQDKPSKYKGSEKFRKEKEVAAVVQESLFNLAK